MQIERLPSARLKIKEESWLCASLIFNRPSGWPLDFRELVPQTLCRVARQLRRQHPSSDLLGRAAPLHVFWLLQHHTHCVRCRFLLIQRRAIARRRSLLSGLLRLQPQQLHRCRLRIKWRLHYIIMLLRLLQLLLLLLLLGRLRSYLQRPALELTDEVRKPLHFDWRR